MTVRQFMDVESAENIYRNIARPFIRADFLHRDCLIVRF